MGILDEAIREHLELKRRSGAADSELKRLEDEAFGPPSRPGDPDFPDSDEAAVLAGNGATAETTVAEAPSAPEAPITPTPEPQTPEPQEPEPQEDEGPEDLRFEDLDLDTGESHPEPPSQEDRIEPHAEPPADLPIESLETVEHPFPDEVTASPVGATVAWIFNERGVRNVYAADAPDFKARRVTTYTDDDGEELTNLTFSPDGKTIVYVRGGDHGANWPADGNVMPDPASSPTQPRMQIWAVAAGGGTPKLLGDGDEPAVAPHTGRVAFAKDRRIWVAPIDGSTPAEPAFFAKPD